MTGKTIHQYHRWYVPSALCEGGSFDRWWYSYPKSSDANLWWFIVILCICLRNYPTCPPIWIRIYVYCWSIICPFRLLCIYIYFSDSSIYRSNLSNLSNPIYLSVASSLSDLSIYLWTYLYLFSYLKHISSTSQGFCLASHSFAYLTLYLLSIYRSVAFICLFAYPSTDLVLHLSSLCVDVSL